MTTIKTLSGFQVQELQIVADLHPELGLVVNKTTAQVPDVNMALHAVHDQIDALARQRRQSRDPYEISTLKGRNNALHSVKRKLFVALDAEVLAMEIEKSNGV